MSEILLFGGTTEGRELAEFLCENEIETDVSVVTDYGAELLPESKFIHKLTGRKDFSEMEKLISEKNYSIVIDATHPYAVEVTMNIKSVCEKLKKKYIRIVREEKNELCGKQFDSLSEVIKYLNKTDNVILSTLGSKEVSELTKIKNYSNRLWVRILDKEDMIKYCEKCGILRSHIIAGKGPFSVEQNTEHIKMSNASCLLTKESGKTGGFFEKAESAELCKIELLVLKRPKEEGFSLDEAEKMILNCLKRR